MLNFDYHNIKIEKGKNTNQVVVRGEVTNCTGKNYTTVAVRIVLFIKNTAIANTVFVINGLPNSSSKPFEKVIDELDYNQVGRDITRHEIYTESGF